MELDYEVVYRPGRVHQVPDALSRLPRRDSVPEDEVDEGLPTFVETLEEARRIVGLDVVMDRCLKIEHARFHGGLHLAGFDTGVVDSRRTVRSQ